MKHVAPAELDDEVTAALRRVLAYLDEHGWCQGKACTANGSACVAYAFQQEGGGLCSEAALRVRKLVNGRGTGSLEVWNDNPELTYGDVRAVLLKAMALDVVV